MNEITAIILTLNEEKHIEACIKSLNWADRVLVFDSHSQDETVGLAKAVGAEVGMAVFQNYAQQRNAALDFVETDWVFFVDADERATPDLANEIRDVVASRSEMGWYVPRHNYIFGRITPGAGWWPDYQLRLFKHGNVRYERPVHEVAVVDGEIGHLINPLTHYNYESVDQFHEKQRSYTDYEAGILLADGIRPKPYTPFTQALRQFWWRFVTLDGYKVGLHGLRLSTFMAYYEWLKYRRMRAMVQKT